LISTFSLEVAFLICNCSLNTFEKYLDYSSLSDVLAKSRMLIMLQSVHLMRIQRSMYKTLLYMSTRHENIDIIITVQWLPIVTTRWEVKIWWTNYKIRIYSVYPFLECEYIFSGVRVTRSLALCVCFIDRVCIVVLFLLTIVLSVLRCTDSDYRFDIFNLFLHSAFLTGNVV
jgi:hypothetical protein